LFPEEKYDKFVFVATGILIQWVIMKNPLIPFELIEYEYRGIRGKI